MAKKEKAVYAPGELSQVREKLGNIDADEAKRMARLLGGEVGIEQAQGPAPIQRSRSRHETLEARAPGRNGSQPRRRVELASEADGRNTGTIPQNKPVDPLDNPAVPIKLSYRERVKMDRYAGQQTFEVKSAGQVIYSIISIFKEPPDYISPVFVTQRMNGYYKQIELLVSSTRTLLPRNNLQRNERFKKASPFGFIILDTIRNWDIERISGDLTRLQIQPGKAKSVDFADILRAVYKPLFLLEKLDFQNHIKESFKLLYRILYRENPGKAKRNAQELIRTALSSYNLIRRDVQLMLYPILLRLLSGQWLPYDLFFIERKNRFMAFLNVSEEDQLNPDKKILPPPDASGKANNEDEDETETEEEKEKRVNAEAEKKAVDRGLHTLDTLFPQAGWDRIDTFPDLYPYFRDVLDLRSEYALIAPTDPLLQTAILLRILEELFFGLRYVSFGSVTGPDGSQEPVGEILGEMINSWRRYIELSFDKEYLPRLSEYCRILESSAESRNSSYAKRLLNELNLAKRIYFLPYHKFDSAFPSPFQKQELSPLYPQVRQLRKYLTAIAAGIDRGNKQGGADKRVACNGIDNPWEPYAFQIANPLSRRLDVLLTKRKNNASLIFFTLAVSTVLDYLMNNENSWAYGEDRPVTPFRSVDNAGLMPAGVDEDVDAEAIFKESLKTRDTNEKNTDQEQV
jgi:hypothetical protein